MIDLTLPIIGPAARALAHHRALAQRKTRLSMLDFGTPGSGKTHVMDLLALELAGPEKGSKFAIEQVNGQSLTVEVIREWRKKACVGNLFSKWTIKRVDELDSASPAARNELLSLIDYIPERYAILATTNNYGSLRGDNQRRLESRFVCTEVNGPNIEEAAAYLVMHKGIPVEVAHDIAECARPDGELLDDLGVNMRLCMDDADSWLASQESAALAA